MKTSRILNRSLTAFILSLATFCLNAQGTTQSSDFVPHVGQPGKDVIWVPTPYELVNKMLEIAEVKAQDFLIDLGSGDGRTVIAAAKLGVKAEGIEFNPEMVALSKKKAEEAGVADKTTFIQEDLFKCDLSGATVITMFLLPEINLKLRPTLLDLKPGTRIVSNTFTMGEWEPDNQAITDDSSSNWNTALMWIVPAKVEGTWKLPPGELKIMQEFQLFFGTYKVGDKTYKISDGKLSGDKISFRINQDNYTGQMTGKDSILGTVTTSSTKSDWAATRIQN